MKESAKLNIKLSAGDYRVSDDRVSRTLRNDDVNFLERAGRVSVIIALRVLDEDARTGLRPSAGWDNEHKYRQKITGQHAHSPLCFPALFLGRPALSPYKLIVFPSRLQSCWIEAKLYYPPLALPWRATAPGVCLSGEYLKVDPYGLSKSKSVSDVGTSLGWATRVGI